MELAPLETLLSVYGHLGVSATPGGNNNNNGAAGGANDSNKRSSSEDESSESTPMNVPAAKKRKPTPQKEVKKKQETTSTTTSTSRKTQNSKKPTPSPSPDASSVSGDEGPSTSSTRFRWSDELHQYFLACVFELGLEIASPKKVFNKMMADPQFAKSLLDEDMYNQMLNPDAPRKFGAHHVKSHLQRFRSNIVNPRAVFVKQVAELMEEAKKKRKEEGKSSKVLNPEYHAYPFAVDRTFPDNIQATQGPSPSLTSMSLLQKQSQVVSSAGHTSSSSSSVLLGRPRTLSSYEAGEQMRAQVEMRERIESQGHRQVVARSRHEDFDSLPPAALNDDDNLFDWLAPDFFPRGEDAGGEGGGGNNNNASQNGSERGSSKER